VTVVQTVPVHAGRPGRKLRGVANARGGCGAAKRGKKNRKITRSRISILSVSVHGGKYGREQPGGNLELVQSGEKNGSSGERTEMRRKSRYPLDASTKHATGEFDDKTRNRSGYATTKGKRTTVVRLRQKN